MAPARFKASAAGDLPSTSARSRCSVETYWSLRASASRRACFRVPSSLDETCVAAPWVLGKEERLFSTSAARPPAFTPSLPRAEGTTPPSCSRSAFRRCSGITSGWSLFSARVCAVVKASWPLTVN